MTPLTPNGWSPALLAAGRRSFAATAGVVLQRVLAEPRVDGRRPTLAQPPYACPYRGCRAARGGNADPKATAGRQTAPDLSRSPSALRARPLTSERPPLGVQRVAGSVNGPTIVGVVKLASCGRERRRWRAGRRRRRRRRRRRPAPAGVQPGPDRGPRPGPPRRRAAVQRDRLEVSERSRHGLFGGRGGGVLCWGEKRGLPRPKWGSRSPYLGIEILTERAGKPTPRVLEPRFHFQAL